jgi:DNA-binding NarL/FixJ family response regulator
MSVRYRPMEPRDARACAAVVARHPVVGPRYGKTIEYLASAWLKLLGRDSFVAAVFEEERGSGPAVLGAGVAVFVTDEFLLDLKSIPPFWIGPELAARIHRGKSPVLTDRQVRDANTSGGLNIAVWQRGVLPKDIARAEICNTIMSAFVDFHRGFLLKELVVQAETAEHVESCRTIGSFLWNPAKAAYQRLDGTTPDELLNEPHVLGLSRDLASKLGGSWGASAFLYHAPRFCFSRSEQRLLSCGLGGGTDQEIADKLGISLVAVRKRWRAIYERVGAISPELAPNPIQEDGGSGERGKAKKQRLLAYVREHPEELRPVSRRLADIPNPNGEPKLLPAAKRRHSKLR